MSETTTKKKRVLISTWSDPETKAEFGRVATANEHTEQSMLRLLINTFLKKNVGTVDPSSVEQGTRDERCNFRLTKAEKAAVEERASAKGYKFSQYMRQMVRAHLSKAAHFNDAELIALREANRQLAAVGKNINQIARALSASQDKASQAQTVELKEVRALIDEHRATIVSLVRENLKSWGVEKDEQSFE